jgi:lysozyme
LNISDECRRKLIEPSEGLVLRTYRDSGGVPTIGFGHTSAAGNPHVIMGMTITEQEADKILSDDLNSVAKTINEVVKVTLKQYQFDALGDFQLNTGWLLHPHCSLLINLNRGNYNLAAEDFALYDYAAGRYLRGLAERREKERTLFLTGTYPT